MESLANCIKKHLIDVRHNFVRKLVRRKTVVHMPVKCQRAYFVVRVYLKILEVKASFMPPSRMDIGGLRHIISRTFVSVVVKFAKPINELSF